MKPTNDENRASSAPIPTVNSVDDACLPAETAVGDFALPPANKPLIGSEIHPDVTSTNTKRNTAVTACHHCGTEFTPKRPQRARFCSAGCRRSAWLAAHPERAVVYAARDKARLKAHIQGRGGVWVD